MPLKNIIRFGLWFIAIGIFAYGAWHYWSELQKLEKGYQERVETALLNFDVEWLARAQDERGFGGALGLAPHGIFLLQQAPRGKIYFLAENDDTITDTGLTLPETNKALIPAETPNGGRLDRELHRYNDIAILSGENGNQLLVSYSYFNPDDQCFVSRLAAMELPGDWQERVLNGNPGGFADWQVIYETDPCLPIIEGAAYPYTGHQAGGRLAIAESGTVYLTVGDYAFDGLEGKLPPHPQIPETSYGKVVALTPTENGVWQSEIFAMGLRNPQGIAIDRSGQIWETEHAAMGGDELNLISQGENYGWPEVTLGVNYTDESSDEKYWPFNPEQGRHENYRLPAYAWVPSIAPSSLNLIEGVAPRWDGDLLLGTLKYGSLLRLRIEGQRVLYAERINLVRRIRYALPAHGRIYLLGDYGELAVMTPRDTVEQYSEFAPLLTESFDPTDPGAVTRIVSGGILASNGCYECHSGDDSPSLDRIVGRDIASQPGVAYSESLQAVPGTWTEENLRAFLADPEAFAPGTLMPDRALSDETIDAIIAALKENSGD